MRELSEEVRVIKDEWYIQGAPEARFKGILRFGGENEASLDLFDNLTLEQLESNDTVIGSNCVLVRCYWDSKSKYIHPLFVIDNFSYEKNKDIKFNCIKINYPILPYLMNVSKIDFDHDSFILKYDGPDEISVLDESDISIKIISEARASVERSAGNIQSKHFIIYHTKNDRLGLMKIIDLNNYISAVLSLLSDSLVKKEEIILYNSEDSFRSSFFSGGKSRLSPELINKKDRNNGVHFEQISNFIECIRESILNRDELEDILLSLQENRYDNSFTVAKFLNTSRSIEAYMRRFKRYKKTINSDFRERLETALVDAPEDIREWCLFKIDKKSGANLKESLERLLKETDHKLFRDLIPDISKFCELVTNTRNYLTHYEIKRKQKSAEILETYYLNTKLELLLKYHCLLQLNVPKPTVDNLAKNWSYGYEHMKDL